MAGPTGQEETLYISSIHELSTQQYMHTYITYIIHTYMHTYIHTYTDTHTQHIIYIIIVHPESFRSNASIAAMHLRAFASTVRDRAGACDRAYVRIYVCNVKSI